MAYCAETFMKVFFVKVRKNIIQKKREWEIRSDVIWGSINEKFKKVSSSFLMSLYLKLSKALPENDSGNILKREYINDNIDKRTNQ